MSNATQQLPQRATIAICARFYECRLVPQPDGRICLVIEKDAGATPNQHTAGRLTVEIDAACRKTRSRRYPMGWTYVSPRRFEELQSIIKA